MATEPERLALARTPTPLEAFDGLIPYCTIQVKRDDLTGSGLSGNKVRKLEYLLADAMRRGAQRVLTCGGIQSNHCRATAIAAARLALGCQLFLRTDKPPTEDDPGTGNLALSRLVGADITFLTREQYKDRQSIMAAAAGPHDYVIPEGGSNALGSWGYIRAFDELASQWESPPSAIICATGSGGTLTGLTLGARRAGLDVRILGVCVCDDSATFRAIAAGIAEEAHARWPSLPQLGREDFDFVDGWVGRGYALSTPAERNDIARVARASGLILDPVYTGKAFRALLRQPETFGESPLFVHTGGIFGLLA